MSMEKRALPSLTALKRIIGENFDRFVGIITGAYPVSVYKDASQSNITAGTGGAIPITNYLTTINTDAGGDAFTLASGDKEGQMKKIQLVVDGGGDGVVTGLFATASNGTTLTFNDAGDIVILRW